MTFTNIKVGSTHPKRLRPGDKFGRLTVLGEQFLVGQNRLCVAECSCGTVRTFYVGNITSNKTHSCGCQAVEMTKVRNRRHGFVKTRLYEIWQHMKRRCFNETDQAYPNYGGRGITVCKEWMDMQAFGDWAIANGYNDELTIDRIDNNGNYEPGNCRWANYTEQGRNKRNNRLLTLNGVTRCLSEWAEIVPFHIGTLEKRIRAGWSDNDVLTKRSRKSRNCCDSRGKRLPDVEVQR